MQQSLLRADAREEWRNSERREQHANPGTKGQAPAQRANEQPQIAGVTDDTVDTARDQGVAGLNGHKAAEVYADLPIDDLIEALIERAPADAKLREAVRPPSTPYQRNLPADDKPIAPSDVATAVNDLFDRHGAMPMTADVGDCLFVAMEIENTALAAPGYYAGMGFGVPAGIGVAAATGRRPLVLVGDGAFQMTGWELGNCRRYGLDPIVVLFNNASWEMLRTFQPESRFNDLAEWNFAAIAPSLGGYGERVRTRRELKEAIERAAVRRGEFALVEVMLPRGATSRTLARFVSGFKAVRARTS